MEEKKCLKCGRQCPENQAFCDVCRAEMEKYPVRPGVVVLLPPKEQAKPAPRRRHAPLPPEEQLAKLKKRVLALWLSLILALAAAGGLGWLALSEYWEAENARPLPGQNYSSDSDFLPEEAP